MPEADLVGHLVAGAYAALFLIAALSKVDGWKSWRSTAASIAGGSLLAPAVRWGVPIAEAACAALLLSLPRIGLAAGAVILWMFSIGAAMLARRLRGRECGCFGAFMPAQISLGLALRNVALACGASVAVMFAPAEPGGFRLGEVLILVLALAVALPTAEFVRFRRLLRSETHG